MKLNRKALRRLIESILRENKTGDNPFQGNVMLAMFRNDPDDKHFNKFLASDFMENPGMSTLEDRLIHRDTVGSFVDLDDDDFLKASDIFIQKGPAAFAKEFDCSVIAGKINGDQLFLQYFNPDGKVLKSGNIDTKLKDPEYSKQLKQFFIAVGNKGARMRVRF